MNGPVEVALENFIAPYRNTRSIWELREMEEAFRAGWKAKEANR